MVEYDTPIGTSLVGIFFNTYLYGLVTYQFAVYHRTKFSDRPTIKYMVLFLFLLDTLHTVIMIYSAWYYVVKNYDTPAMLGLNQWTYPFTPISTALAAFVTQIYLGFRILSLTRSKLLYSVVIALAVPSFILGVVSGIEEGIVSYLSAFSSLTSFTIAWLSVQVVADTFVTVTLIIIFARWRGGFRRTDTILNRLIRGAVQTGLFAGIFSIGLLITFAFVPSMHLYAIFGIPLGRIYTNTLMDTLLTRESMKAQMVDVHESDPIDLPPVGPSEPRVTSVAQSASIREMDNLSSRGRAVGRIDPLPSVV